MKSLILFLLLLGGAAKLCGQQLIVNLPGTATANNPTLSANYFDAVAANPTPVRIQFNLSRGNQLQLLLNSFNQIDSIPDLEPLLRQALADYRQVTDSAADPLASTRVDYVFLPAGNCMRVRHFAPVGESFSIRNGNIAQLKVEQDTLLLYRYTLHNLSYRHMPPNGIRQLSRTYKVQLLLNHLGDLDSLVNSGVIAKGQALLRADWQKTSSDQRKRLMAYPNVVIYDLNQLERTFPRPNRSLLAYSKKEVTLNVFAETGIQYLRGAWTPSAGLGLELMREFPTTSDITGLSEHRNRYRLLWEPYFTFSRDIAGKLTTRRNDFLTFKYILHSRYRGNARVVEFDQNFSVGYLIHRSGDFFEKNTIKFGLPGLRAKNIMLEPEFYFNNWLKNFSPSLKLTLDFE